MEGDRQEGDELPHHLPEEVRRGDAHEDQIAVSHDLAALDDDDAGVFFRQAAVGEGAEVVAPFELFGGAAHGRGVQTILHPPDERLGEGRAAAGDLVEIDARDRVMPRMKAVVRPLRVQDVDVGRQEVVDLARQLQRIDRLVRAQMGNLPGGMHSRIRAARSDDPRRRQLPTGRIAAHRGRTDHRRRRCSDGVGCDRFGHRHPFAELG